MNIFIIRMIKTNIPKSNIGKVKDVMQVESLEDDDPTFKVKTRNSTQQFIDETQYTEWIYQVTPTQEGVCTLSFMATLYEQIGDKSYPKELIIEKDVTVNNENYRELNPKVGEPGSEDENEPDYKLHGTFVGMIPMMPTGIEPPNNSYSSPYS